ncbi:hypothetical protein [Algoriphagus hitonicola]|uniref:hypothetical protein n=2 Tax=Algoriphagus hitonicola TaxID=435880 RepID=UPI001161305E|nr:hypothetical protein [Algoriphagus hitonicola]
MATSKHSWSTRQAKTSGLPSGKGRFDQFRIMSTGPLIVQETHGACPDELASSGRRSDIGNPWGVELGGLGYQYGEDRALKISPVD